MPMPYRACQSENKIFILNGGNSNSGSRVKQVSFDGFSKFIDQRLVDDSEEALYHALSTARVTKSPYEIEVMRYCNTNNKKLGNIKSCSRFFTTFMYNTNIIILYFFYQYCIFSLCVLFPFPFSLSLSLSFSLSLSLSFSRLDIALG